MQDEIAVGKAGKKADQEVGKYCGKNSYPKNRPESENETTYKTPAKKTKKPQSKEESNFELVNKPEKFNVAKTSHFLPVEKRSKSNFKNCEELIYGHSCDIDEHNRDIYFGSANYNMEKAKCNWQCNRKEEGLLKDNIQIAENSYNIRELLPHRSTGEISAQHYKLKNVGKRGIFPIKYAGNSEIKSAVLYTGVADLSQETMEKMASKLIYKDTPKLTTSSGSVPRSILVEMKNLAAIKNFTIPKKSAKVNLDKPAEELPLTCKKSAAGDDNILPPTSSKRNLNPEQNAEASSKETKQNSASITVLTLKQLTYELCSEVWNGREIRTLIYAFINFGNDYNKISTFIGTKSTSKVKQFLQNKKVEEAMQNVNAVFR